MSNSRQYIVALRYTSKTGGYAGVITWTSFESAESFRAWFASQDKQEVVEEDITEERAVELTKTTPIKCYLMAAVEEVCNSETGEVDAFLLSMKIDQIFMTHEMNKTA